MASADAEQASSCPDPAEERILVSVRLRPLNHKETCRNEPLDWECIDHTTIVYNNNNLSPERSLYPNSFTFDALLIILILAIAFDLDRVFRSDSSTRQVYEEGAKAVVLSALSGINSSVFAYGQTSSGKTFTMSGITEYTMEDIFNYIYKHKERDFHLRFSAMEIYNESVRDLLTADNSPLRLLDDPERGTVVEKLTEEVLHDWSHFKELLAMCEAQRQIGETFLNEVSSRSHQILRLTIESSNREFLGKNNCSTLAATLNFVDLAGSERASQALSAGSRLKEGSHINRSLLTLGTVIRKLSKGQTGHIPYRDSKLTRILQSSLGGNARTALICTMSPARSYVEQSRNTLLFASCAKEVTTDARVNVVMSDKALMKHLQRELVRLEGELRNASPSTRSDATDQLREKDYKIDELERRVKELTVQLDLALSQIQNLQQGIRERRPFEEDSSYPKLHVRQASEHSSSFTTTMVDHNSLSAHSLTFNPLESPDRQSRLSYDENYSVSDIDENNSPSSSFEGVFIEKPFDASLAMHIQTTIVSGNDHPRVPKGFEEQTNDFPEADQNRVSEETGGRAPNSFEIDLHHMTEEIGEEASNTFELCLQHVSVGNESQFPNFVEFDPYQVSEKNGEKTPNSYEFDQYHVAEGIAEKTPNSCDFEQYHGSVETAEKTLNSYEFDQYHLSEGTAETTPNSYEIYQYHDSERIAETTSYYDDINPQQASEAVGEQIDNNLEKHCKEVHCIVSENVLGNIWAPEEERKSLFLLGCVNDSCTDKEPKEHSELDNMNSSSRQDYEEPGRQLMNGVPKIQNLNGVENSSLSNDVSISSPSSLVDVKYKIKYESGDGEVFTLDDSNGKLSALNNNNDYKLPQISIGDVGLDETQVADVNVSNHMDKTENHTSVSIKKEVTRGKSMDQVQLQKLQVEDTFQKANNSIKNMKDSGLNPKDDLCDSSLWSADVKRLQREIIDLWDSCNILLVHRTSFFLLFIKGDQADTIYMEVERRRLSCINNAFSWGNSIVLDGRQLTPGSSRRSLHKERKMLTKLMKRRFSSQERMDLYVRWGINLDSKRRSSQLAHLLWANTVDMDHILESAKIVAKLVRLNEPQVPKEVFGLNLSTTQVRRKSFSSKILAVPCKNTFMDGNH
ncbi:kinesin-like protein KIN-7E isoform X2 [Chenopodium quinoa]|uniref:kinesin-like protein KIN-7E isoform X2 n=1 Tax=Chenopodium quinoa TaxID=63459 RepID=UPI000B796636|nr:kinesin-like protein KIN-7E isoform X2 [Chenopodium quinoa]